MDGSKPGREIRWLFVKKGPFWASEPDFLIFLAIFKEEQGNLKENDYWLDSVHLYQKMLVRNSGDTAERLSLS